MPEGDTIVWTAARLNRAFAAAPVLRSDIRVPQHATLDLSGQRYLTTGTYGKHLFHRFDGGITLHTHLKMEGRWSTLLLGSQPRPSDVAQLRKAERSHTTRALLYYPDGVAIGSSLGLVDALPTSAEHTVTDALGPDVLGETFEIENVVERVRCARDDTLAAALLNQRNLAGLGTFWTSEMLFLHQVFPWTPPADVPAAALTAVLTSARSLMQRSARSGMQASTPRETPDGKYVHARSGLSCHRCGDIIRVAMAGPPTRERTIFSCPTCQGGLAPSDDGRPQQALIERPRGKPRYRRP